MAQKLCKLCGKPIPDDKRSDTEFCNNTEKAKYWAEQKKNGLPKQKDITVQPPTPKEGNNDTDAKVLASTLRGIIDNGDDPPSTNKDEISYHKPEPQTDSAQTLDELIACVTQKRDALNGEHEKLSAKIRDCEIRLKMVNGECKVGSFPKYLFHTPQQKNEIRNEIEKKKSALERMDQAILNEWAKAFLQLIEFTKQKENQSASQNKKSTEKEPDAEENIEEKKFEKIKDSSNETNIPNVISYNDIMRIKHQSLNFTGKWLDFIGQPEPVFHCVVHGKPGGGKSTFCFKKAHYLAENFGKVLYISAEEGFSKTVQDKLKLVNGNRQSNNLSFGAQKSFDQIMREIPQNLYHFIFIDSLDTLKIGAERLKELREFYKNSAFITISQSTKDGKMRGSQEIIHDCDIEIPVTDGVAFTKKNRFRVTGKMYQIFDDGNEAERNKKDKPMEPPRNVV